MALHVAHLVRSRVVIERPVGHHEVPRAGQVLGQLGLSPAHRVVERPHQRGRIVVGHRRRVVFQPGRQWREAGGIPLAEQRHPYHLGPHHLAPGNLAVPHHGTDRERPANPRHRAGLVVEQQPGVDPPHPVDEGHDRNPVVGPGNRLPRAFLHIGVDRPLGRGKSIFGFDGGPVLRGPPLNMQSGHGERW
jgi:hypothetical protein